MTRPWIRATGLCLVPVLLGACVTRVQMAPRSFDWTQSPGEAVWQSGSVAVAASLTTEDLAYPVAATLHSTRPGTRFSFESSGAASAEPVGRVFLGGDERPVVPGEWYTIPGGADGEAEFVLRPDAPWSDPPPVDSALTYVLLVQDDGETVRRPFRFRVDSTSRILGPEARVVALIVLVPVLVVVVAAGGLASAHGSGSFSGMRFPQLRIPAGTDMH